MLLSLTDVIGQGDDVGQGDQRPEHLGDQHSLLAAGAPLRYHRAPAGPRPDRGFDRYIFTGWVGIAWGMEKSLRNCECPVTTSRSCIVAPISIEISLVLITSGS